MKLDLTEIKKRFQPRSVLAFTIESGRVIVGVASNRNGEGAISNVQSIPVGADEIVKEPEKSAAKITAALDASGIRHRRCVVCVPPAWALATSIDLPAVTGEDLRGYLELCAEREFSTAVSELKLACHPYTMPDGRRRAMLAAVSAKRLDAVGKMLAAAGCRPVSISLALDECLQTGKPGLYFLANGTHTDVIVAAGGGIVSMRSLSVSAESEGDAFDRASFCREIRITLGRLPDTVRQQVRSARFAGTPASAARLCNETRESLLQLGLEKVECISPDEGAVAVESAASQAATAYLHGRPVAFEFVVAEVNQWEEMMRRIDSNRSRWIILAAFVLILLPMLVFFIRARMEDHLEAEWNAMKRNVSELDLLQQKIHRFRPWFEPAPQILQGMESVVSAFPDQGDVWAKSIQVTEGYKITCTGFARSQSALLAMLDRLRARPDVASVQVQQMRGDKPVQFSFTCKWNPKHD